MIKILLLEDDLLFAETLIDFLEDEDFSITHLLDGENFLNNAYESYYDIYLMDINVPKLNGLETLQELRNNQNNTPTIFLTSYKDKDTLLQGFLKGCDDYMTKPFDMDELLLRIHALLKRSGKAIDTIEIDNVTYNPSNNTISKDNITLDLTQKVIELFKLCYENNGGIVTKEMIIDRLWGYDENYSEGSIRVYMSKLQSIFESKKITNIKSIGYKVEF